MSCQAEFLKAFLRQGNAATVTKVSGTACPCMTSRDSARQQYSAQWHRDHPTAADCAMTGLISRTTTTIAVKGFHLDVGAMLARSDAVANKIPIGELQQGDVMWQGTIRTDTNAFYDLSALSDIADKITIGGVDYRVKLCYNEVIRNETAYQVVLLRRLT